MRRPQQGEEPTSQYTPQELLGYVSLEDEEVIYGWFCLRRISLTSSSPNGLRSHGGGGGRKASRSAPPIGCSRRSSCTPESTSTRSGRRVQWVPLVCIADLQTRGGAKMAAPTVAVKEPEPNQLSEGTTWLSTLPKAASEEFQRQITLEQSWQDELVGLITGLYT